MSRRPSAARTAGLVVAAAGLGLALLGCAGGDIGEESGPRAGLSCIDDSVHCIAQRKATLNALTGDKTRAWIKEQPTPAAYASGVRLFAFKKSKKELSCEELHIARKEADAGPAVLRGPGGAGLTTVQISRGAMLSTEVGRELGQEIGRRCSKG